MLASPLQADSDPAHMSMPRSGPAHLATLTRDTIVIGGHQIEKITTATRAQREAFELLGTPIPITLE